MTNETRCFIRDLKILLDNVIRKSFLLSLQNMSILQVIWFILQVIWLFPFNIVRYSKMDGGGGALFSVYHLFFCRRPSLKMSRVLFNNVHFDWLLFLLDTKKFSHKYSIQYNSFFSRFIHSHPSYFFSLTL